MQLRMHLTERDVFIICSLIKENARALTWKGIVAITADKLGHTWTRQALARHPTIEAAYRGKRGSKKPMKPRIDLSLDFLLAKIRAFEEENQQLKELIKTYQAMFVRYQHNAHARGISQAELDKPFLDRKSTRLNSSH